MFRGKINREDEPCYKININPVNAPDCTHCHYYWNNRKDNDYRKTIQNGYWCETIKFYEDGSEKSFSRISTFKHGCRYFDVFVPPNQLPSLYIYGQIGKYCPMDINSTLNKNYRSEDSKPKSQSYFIQEDHEIDIKV